MIPELKPCPFCGRKPYVVDHRPFRDSVTIYCEDNTHKVVVAGRTIDETGAMWNTRHKETTDAER